MVFTSMITPAFLNDLGGKLVGNKDFCKALSTLTKRVVIRETERLSSTTNSATVNVGPTGQKNVESCAPAPQMLSQANG